MLSLGIFLFLGSGNQPPRASPLLLAFSLDYPCELTHPISASSNPQAPCTQLTTGKCLSDYERCCPNLAWVEKTLEGREGGIVSSAAWLESETG